MAQRPAWYYQRQADQATARENYYRNNIPTPPATVNTRGAATQLFYRSLLLSDGTNPLVFSTSVYDTTLAIVPAATAGLLTAAPAGEAVRPLRNSGVKPSKVSWYQGDATPSRQTTPWGSSWTKYYSSAGNQSHYSIPWSRTTGTFTATDLVDAFNTFFNSNADTVLGAANGRAQLTLERAPVSYLT